MWIAYSMPLFFLLQTERNRWVFFKDFGPKKNVSKTEKKHETKYREKVREWKNRQRYFSFKLFFIQFIIHGIFPDFSFSESECVCVRATFFFLFLYTVYSFLFAMEYACIHKFCTENGIQIVKNWSTRNAFSFSLFFLFLPAICKWITRKGNE